MNPGELDTLFDIQAVTRTRDTMGGVVEAWATVATEWGGIKPITGREYLGAQQERAEITERIVMHYRVLLPRTNRLKAGSVIYDIEHVAVKGRNASLELMVKRRVE